MIQLNLLWSITDPSRPVILARQSENLNCLYSLSGSIFILLVFAFLCAPPSFDMNCPFALAPTDPQSVCLPLLQSFLLRRSNQSTTINNPFLSLVTFINRVIECNLMMTPSRDPFGIRTVSLCYCWMPLTVCYCGSHT